MAAKIKSIQAREILDSIGNPTLEVKVITDDGSVGVAAVPSGTSTGTYEALELRDNDPERYRGLGVIKAVENVNTKLASLLKGELVTKQQEIDQKMIELDGTANKAHLGANAILGVSLACAKAAALANKLPLYTYLRSKTEIKGSYQLPLPMLLMMEGGKHADNDLDIQELMIILKNPSFKERIRMGAEVYHSLKRVLKTKNYPRAVGFEGGFSPKVKTNKEAIDLVLLAISRTKFTMGADVSLALDLAASEYYQSASQKYFLKLEQLNLTSDELINLYAEWQAQYPIVSLEDCLEEDDFIGWEKLTNRLGKKIQLVGDDLFVTNPSRLQKGIDKKIANAIIIKLNQIGTLTETLACIKLAQANNYKLVVSHRSGETSDTFIADLSVAVDADFIKTGAPCRGERVAKYNRLMEIEEELNKL